MMLCFLFIISKIIVYGILDNSSPEVETLSLGEMRGSLKKSVLTRQLVSYITWLSGPVEGVVWVAGH